MPRMAILLAFMACSAPSAAQEPDDALLGPVWGYIYARCMPEQVEVPENPCQVALDETPVFTNIFSNVVRFDSKSFDPHAAFAREVKRIHNLEIGADEQTTFSSWAEAEEMMAKIIRLNRQVDGGEIAFYGASLEPERLADEPNAEEARALPSALPPLMEGFRTPQLELRQDDSSCSLFDPQTDSEILPELVTEAFGEAGEGCPFQLQEGYGLYAFHVKRNGGICPTFGTCTEFYDGFGFHLLTADFSPHPSENTPDLFRRGIIVTGTGRQRLYSFPERRYLHGPVPFANLPDDAMVAVTGSIIRHDRPAVLFDATTPAGEHWGSAYFYLDTRRFELVTNDQGVSSALPETPAHLAAFEEAAIAPCADNAGWAGSDRTRHYLEQAYFEADKRIGAILGLLDAEIAQAIAVPPDQQTGRFKRIGTRLDEVAHHTARLLPGMEGAADSSANARLAAAFEFRTLGIPQGDADHTTHLRHALALEALEGRNAHVGASETIDGYLSALARLRFLARQAEAGRVEGEALTQAAQDLDRLWETGIRTPFREIIFAGDDKSVADLLHPRVERACAWWDK